MQRRFLCFILLRCAAKIFYTPYEEEMDLWRLPERCAVPARAPWAVWAMSPTGPANEDNGKLCRP